MNKSFKDRIIKAQGEPIKHGKYTYYIDVWTGDILRCVSSDIGREWIDREGNRRSAWEVIDHA